MISIPGTLEVRAIHGRHGWFNIATLTADLGEFSVESGELEQYDEGTYDGQFTIERIYAYAYPINDRTATITKVRAEVVAMSLEGFEEGLADDNDVPAELDASLPADVRSGESQILATSPIDPAASVPASQEDAHSKGASLFGALWPLADELDLDTTVDRSRLVQQTDYLKANAYKFSFKSQRWTRG